MRAFDVLGALAGLTVFAPAMAAIAAAILIDDGSPASIAFGKTRIRRWLRRRGITSG